MPVTAKLSQKFYQRLGDDVANELVEWLNLVDTSYRQEFKDLFAANFGQVDARMAALEVKMDALEERTEAKLDGLRGEIRSGFAGAGDRAQAMESRIDAKLGGLKAELLRWMFLFWVGTMGTVLAILKL